MSFIPDRPPDPSPQPKPPMPTRTHLGRLLLGLAWLPAVSEQSGSTDDSVISLNEFSVSAEQVTGYRAGTSLTATGVGARIMDTPIAINVLTGEFLRDTSVSELR